MGDKKRKEPTWEETLKIIRKQVAERLAPMKQAMIENCLDKWKKSINKKKKQG